MTAPTPEQERRVKRVGLCGGGSAPGAMTFCDPFRHFVCGAHQEIAAYGASEFERGVAKGREAGLEEAAKVADAFEAGRRGFRAPEEFLKLVGGETKEYWGLMVEGGRLCATGIAAEIRVLSTAHGEGEKRHGTNGTQAGAAK